jgi:hypothetical protein
MTREDLTTLVDDHYWAIGLIAFYRLRGDSR